ncbi:MAG: methionyl-tRNA formyltransferase [Spirochaetaceae bacterium]|jgi:methionyl-tRNA formyltransferase|nr:methionyl-tRNA formyltransferase [Spirochaetaceae bacterium]
MRILFAGSPGIAVPSLGALAAMQIAGADITVAGVLTNPDSPRGRSGKPEPTEVSAAAEELSQKLERLGHSGIAQFKPETLGPEAREAAAGLKPDLLVSFAYKRIFGPKFLGIFPLGGINVHPSLLPKYRGASPIPAAILNRDTETGISIQSIAAEPDSGLIIAQERFPLQDRETAATLSERVAQKAGAMLPAILEAIARNGITGTAQTGEVSYCALLSKADGLIDWTLPADAIDAQIRAYTPWPLARTAHRGQYLYLLTAEPYKNAGAFSGKAVPGGVLGTDKTAGILVQTGRGVLGITRLQYQTKKALDWRTFLNGSRNFLEAVLG